MPPAETLEQPRAVRSWSSSLKTLALDSTEKPLTHESILRNDGSHMCLVLLQHSDIKDGLGKSDGLLTAVPLRHVEPNYRGRGNYVGGVR